jgi:mRNA interferase MazF
VLKRGQLISIAIQGDFGKPRPALVIQSDMFNETHNTVTVALITSDLIDAPIFRVNIDPTEENGLNHKSQIQVDKMMTIKKDKVGSVIGKADDTTMIKINRATALWVGLA